MINFFKRLSLGRFMLMASLIIVLVLQFSGKSVLAVEISKIDRTVPMNEAGDIIILSENQIANGQQKFNKACASCHLDGGTKPNPDINLSTEVLSLATPRRDNLEGLVDYLKHPTTYDGLESLEDLHPSMARSDLFTRMRDLTEDDLVDVSGYVLAQPNLAGRAWATGKPGR